ncbi:uncharacterized protein LOC142620109 [Castanea sativa]|uniref:uncharacterized protein LOC142620109 n=1 Tax=Castanea sativa TaxID=21020 RepID=UPI003F64E5E0
MVSSLIDIENRRWNAELIRSLFLPFDANTILNIPLSYNLPKGKVIWIGNRKGEFTVRSAYYITLKVIESDEVGESSYGDPRIPLWGKMWLLKIPAKIWIFSWRACMNALPTKLNLNRKGIDTTVSCPICDQEAETIMDALITCDSARQVWDRWVECPVNLSSAHLDVSDIALKILADGTSKDLETFFVTSWSLWYSRNQVVFETNNQTPNQVWNFARRITQDYKEASNLFSCGDGNPSSIEVIIKDNRGETIAALRMPLNGQYPSLETEVIALEKGVLLAKEMELQQIMLETDALTVVQSLLIGNKEGDLEHLLQGISDTLNPFSSWQIKHLKRDCNRVAHELAQLAKFTGTKQVWKGVSPPTVQHLIQLEKV